MFVQPSHGFKLPVDGNKAVIMVGPGTGIAPFRAFLEEREATGATGKNWLFFGDQRRTADFLYEEQLISWAKSGRSRPTRPRLLPRSGRESLCAGSYARTSSGLVVVVGGWGALLCLWRCLTHGKRC